jgi:hypothetical protein
MLVYVQNTNECLYDKTQMLYAGIIVIMKQLADKTIWFVITTVNKVLWMCLGYSGGKYIVDSGIKYSEISAT